MDAISFHSLQKTGKNHEEASIWLQTAAHQAARSTDLQRTPLVTHSWFVSTNYLFNGKTKGNASWITVAFSRVNPEIKSNSPVKV